MMLASDLGTVDCKPHVVLHGVREAFHIHLIWSRPILPVFHHAAIFYAL
ncbi:MAG: hypothetical protein OXD42_04525 [Rhodospirillaceae bacterium]|nr:hypothetical protein [Rhodospirillaceae bacterium]